MEESEPENKKKKTRNPRTSQGSLRLVLKHADLLDTLLMILGTIGCFADGSSVAANMLVLGSLMNSYGRGASAFNPDDINKVNILQSYTSIKACTLYLVL